MGVTIYGIRNCDTMRKALAWLDAHGVDHVFHDYRASGVDPVRIARWCTAAGWERVLNRSGRTFRALPDVDKDGLDEARAVALMAAAPTMIRRPVLETGDTIEIGFRAERYAELFGNRTR